MKEIENKDQLVEIENRTNAATEGPWLGRSTKESEDSDEYVSIHRIGGGPHNSYRVGALDKANRKDVAFIENSREDVPALTKALRKAWDELENFRVVGEGVLRSVNSAKEFADDLNDSASFDEAILNLRQTFNKE